MTLFGIAVMKILDKYKEWNAIAIGNEPREKLFLIIKILKF